METSQSGRKTNTPSTSRRNHARDQRVPRELRDSYWRKRRANLPRGRDGNNSPESMVAGILDNMLYAENPQRDFTDRQCQAIEDISRWMSAVDDSLSEVTFQIGVM